MATQTAHELGDRPARILAVADWSIDAGGVADALRARVDGRSALVQLLVPSRLPGIDWIGDPHASEPCAERQLGELERLARARGLVVEAAKVGDPERVGAISTAAEDWGPDRILLFDRDRAIRSHPLSLGRRVARKTRRPVERIAVARDSVRRRLLWHRAPRCSALSLRTSWS